jgi:ADP-heptose:LPS heptosyltransferase
LNTTEFYVKDVKKIAILRANALGDFIVTLPAISAIRTSYPHAEIVLLGKPWHLEFLKGGRTPVDRVIVIPVCKGIREERDIEENAGELEIFFNSMRKEQFDIAIHFHGKGIAANPFIKNLGARVTAGLTSPEAAPIDRSVDFYYYQPEVMRYLEVVRLIGAAPVMPEPEIKLLQEDKNEALNFLKNFPASPFIVIHPCGMDKRRMWIGEKFARLADIIQQKKYQIIFTGSEQDSETVSSIIARMKYPAVNACGKFSLGGLAAIFSLSDLVISIDTGPLHLARAAGAKTIGIYWAPNLINWGPLSRALHRPVISWNLQCPLCGIIPNDPYPFEPVTSECTHDISFLENISVEEVAQKVAELLATVR